MRLTPEKINDVLWFRATFKKRPAVKKFKKVEEFAYLYPKGSVGEISCIFNIPVSTIQGLLKRRAMDNVPKYGPY